MLTTSMHFLAPLDLYRSEKPYSLRFDPDDSNVPKTNIKLERYDDIAVEDIRGREAEFDLMRDGFTILRLDSAMAYDDFESESKIADIYLKEVADAVKLAVKADFVQIFEHTVSDLSPPNCTSLTVTTRSENAMRHSPSRQEEPTVTISLRPLHTLVIEPLRYLALSLPTDRLDSGLGARAYRENEQRGGG
jgi:hypothetical protein